MCHPTEDESKYVQLFVVSFGRRHLVVVIQVNCREANNTCSWTPADTGEQCIVYEHKEDLYQLEAGVERSHTLRSHHNDSSCPDLR